MPLIHIETVVQLFDWSNQTGLRRIARKEQKEYGAGIRITDKELNEVTLFTHQFHGEWHYTKKPKV